MKNLTGVPNNSLDDCLCIYIYIYIYISLPQPLKKYIGLISLNPQPKE